MRKVFVVFVLLIWSLVQAMEQPVFPENGPLFEDSVVPRVDILIDPDTLDWLYEWENLESDIEYHAIFIYDNGSIREFNDVVLHLEISSQIKDG